jgi:putative transposase
VTIELTDQQRAILEGITRSGKTSFSEVLRATIVLKAAAGARNAAMAEELGTSSETVRLWRGRWKQAVAQLGGIEREGVAQELRTAIQEVLADEPRAGRPATYTAEQICQLLAVACESPAQSGRPVSHWSPRELADEVNKRGLVPGVSVRSVGRFLKRGRLETAAMSVLVEQ